MAEKQKESSSSAKSKGKTALLGDLDIGKDFLTSWKSMAEDDQMDFDFSTVAKGNKKAFKFDNMDMDFKLDDDFGKISSFKVDMSDLDVSSPVKKSGKSKEVSAEKKAQGKSDRSAFQFDFDGFDDFNFEPSLGKTAKQSNANQPERSPSLSGSLGFGTHLKETIGASEGETTSKFDNQLSGEADSSSKEKSQASLTEMHFPSKSEISKDQAVNPVATTSLQKPVSDSMQETDQDNCGKERINLQEPHQERCQNLSVQSLSEDPSTQQTACNSEEEVGCLSRKESTNTEGEQYIFDEKTGFGFNCGNSQLDKLQVDMACSQSNDDENGQYSGDNPVRIYSNNDEPAQSDTQFEQTSTTSAAKKMLREMETDGETMDVTSELVVTQLNSETTGDKELPDSRRVTNIIRSKYFKGSDEAKLQLQQQSSVSQIKPAAFDSKRIETLQLGPADASATMGDKALPDKEGLPNIRSESFKELDETKSQLQQASVSQVTDGTISSHKIAISQPSTAEENGCKLVALPRSSALPREQSNGDSVGIRSQRSPSNLISNRVRLHGMDVAKGEPVLKRSENEDLNTFRKLDNKVAETGRKSFVLPKATREKIEGDSMQTRSQGSPKDLINNRGGYISDNTGRTLTGTSRLHDKDAAKGEPVLSGSGNNIKHLNTFSSHVRPSSSNEKTNKSASLLGVNPRLSVSGIKTLRNNIIPSENQKLPDLKDGGGTSVLYKMNSLRTTETTHPRSTSALQKDSKLLTNSRQGVDLKENRGSRMVHADTTKQESSSPRLKRKKIEESSANLLMLKPTKRLNKSPSGNRSSRELLEKFVGEENIRDGNSENGLNDSQSSCLHIPHKVDMKELETPLEMDNDTNVENAQACAKELDDLANMLIKKHEEAKEILVRAVVNNNKLLMLNHPIHEEKFLLVEEFAALLSK